MDLTTRRSLLRTRETKHLNRKRRAVRKRRRETLRGPLSMRPPRRSKGLLMITNPEGKAVRVLSRIYKF